MQLILEGNFADMERPKYGFDAYGNPVVAEEGYEIIQWNCLILKGDKAFDVYSGWIQTDEWHSENRCYATSSGRWTTWERKCKQTA